VWVLTGENVGSDRRPNVMIRLNRAEKPATSGGVIYSDILSTQQTCVL
jgi:hypothetical protein